MTRKRVTLDSDTHDHVVTYGLFFDGGGAALCGKSPWPQRWAERHSGRSLCAGCAQVLRRRLEGRNR